jgi:hypothetical protein
MLDVHFFASIRSQIQIRLMMTYSIKIFKQASPDLFSPLRGSQFFYVIKRNIQLKDVIKAKTKVLCYLH